MLKYTVKRNGIIISEYTSDFADETYYEENWGKPEHTVELTPLQTIEHKAVKGKKEILDKEGNVIEAASKSKEAYVEKIEATYKTIPSEYIVEIEDISQAIEAEKIKKESKTLERSARVSGLKSIDFTKIKTIADVNTVLKMLVKESIRDEE